MSVHTTTEPTQQPREGAVGSYLAAIRAHPAIFTLITLAAVGASLAFLGFRSSSYEATARMLVEPLPQEDQTLLGLPLLRDTGDPVRTAQTAASLIKSREAAELAAKRLGGGWTGRELFESTVEVGPEGESNILAITATADTPEEAAAVANEFAEAALDARADQLDSAARSLVDQLDARLEATPTADQVSRADLAARLEQVRLILSQGDPTLILLEEAIPPTEATGAPAAVVVFLALLAGLTLGSGTAFMLELVNRRVRDENEALAIYPLPVLARVPVLPERSRRGPRESTWYMPPAIREPFLTLTVQLQQAERASTTAVMVTSPTTGDGKTSCAINLAVSLATVGKRVVLLDFDLLKPEVGTALGMSELRSPWELIDPNASLGRLLARPTELATLGVLGVELDPLGIDLREPTIASLPALINQARELADYVVVDTPPLGEVSDALRFGDAVDGTLLVVRPGNTSRGQLRSTRELLERSGYPVNGLIVMGAVERTGRGYGYGYGAAGALELVIGRQDPELATEVPREGVARAEPRR